jgi:hypothetical protein
MGGGFRDGSLQDREERCHDLVCIHPVSPAISHPAVDAAGLPAGGAAHMPRGAFFLVRTLFYRLGSKLNLVQA